MMLHRQIIKFRLCRNNATWDEFRGLYISEQDVDDLLPHFIEADLLPESTPAIDDTITRLSENIQKLESEISERKNNALSSGIDLRLEYLKQAFNLSSFEIDILLIGLLPELDLRYQKLYAYLQDDVTKKGATIDMILKLRGSSVEDRTVLRSIFLPQGRLLSNHLVSLQDTRSQNSASLLEKIVVIEERISNYLLDSNHIDTRLTTFLRLIDPEVTLSNLLLTDDVKARLHNLIKRRIQNEGAIFYLEGPYGSGKQITAEALCKEWGVPLLVVDLRQILSSDLPIGSVLQLVLREALLQKAYIYFDYFDLLLADNRDVEATRRNILESLSCYTGIVFLGSKLEWEPLGGLLEKPLVKIKLSVPPFDIRKQLWESYSTEYSPVVSDIDIYSLANKFHFTQGQIQDALVIAKNLTLGREEESQITTDDLYHACRTQSNQKLGTLARKIRPKFGWEDIILPKDHIMQLREITDQVRQKHVVYDKWHFGKKLSPHMGLNILFAGPSGTGKTMAAQIIANELGLDLYKIDLATVVSKYIGETEKNLDRIFKEAQDSNAILFFDEADAIFGKRSEVKDSHDRYANIEIAYLLQRMEE